jgi:hypothetical protein
VPDLTAAAPPALVGVVVSLHDPVQVSPLFLEHDIVGPLVENEQVPLPPLQLQSKVPVACVFALPNAPWLTASTWTRLRKSIAMSRLNLDLSMCSSMRLPKSKLSAEVLSRRLGSSSEPPFSGGLY